MFKAGERPTVIRIWNTPQTHLIIRMVMMITIIRITMMAIMKICDNQEFCR